ncbi:uncharacterized protein [Primulina eburnea]|uniref:uncharacterized protein n=1 Tax=Primulina eburnea TaxID=1245227 RepID=UPI003C6C1C4A
MRPYHPILIKVCVSSEQVGGTLVLNWLIRLLTERFPRREFEEMSVAGAKELQIEWGNDSSYWNWTSHAYSRFPEVAELKSGLEVANTEVKFVEDERGKQVEPEEVRPMVVHLQPTKETIRKVATGPIIDGIEFRPVYTEVKFLPNTVLRNRRGRGGGNFSRFTSSQINESFAVDWEKFVMPDYQEIASSSAYWGFSLDGRNRKICYMLGPRRLYIAGGEVEAQLFEKTSKSGLIVEGIKFRPICIEISDTISLDKKAVLPKNRIQGVLRPCGGSTTPSRPTRGQRIGKFIIQSIK